MLQHRAALVFFICYLFVGVFVLSDYGLNWDDNDQRNIGLTNWGYLFENNKDALRNSLDRYHGPAFELLLVAPEKILDIDDYRTIYIVRHVVTFGFFFFSVLAFYSLALALFKTKWVSLLACLLLVLSPRIFAESFYNSKDIPLLSAMIFATLTMFVFVQRPTFKMAVLHGFTSAFAFDIRIFGLLIFLATIFLLLYVVVLDTKMYRKWMQYLMVYVVVAFLFTILFWPILMDNPFRELNAAFIQLSHYSLWGGSNLYFGKLYPASGSPWHYQQVWMVLTTPVFIICCFVAGIFFILYGLWRYRVAFFTSNIYLIVCLGLFIAPFAAMSVLHSTVLDGWRHVYLAYPYFVLIATFGVSQVYQFIKSGIAKNVFLGVVVSFVAYLVFNIAQLHPFQNVYFNPVANYFYSPMESQFEIDYWGLNYKQGFEYVAQHYFTGQAVKIQYANFPGEWNYNFLPKEVKRKLEITENDAEVDYFVTNHRMDRTFPNGLKVYEIRIQGNRVLTIYKRK